MIGFLFKNGKLFLDIVLVVGGILAFTFWDPLGIFNNTKLQATANMVTGVRDIGQLVTAEYYGEVISSWKEFKLTEFPEDTVTSEAKDLFIDLKVALADVDKRFSKLYTDEATRELQRSYGEAFYYKFLTFLGESYFGFNSERIFDEKDNDLKRNYEKKIWQKLYDKGKTYHKSLEKKYDKQNELVAVDFEDYLYDIPDFLDDFYNFYGMLTQRHLESGSNKRKEIVFIGRGWVKAGFDFGKLNEGNFLYDEANKSVHFFGIKPVILDTDINPWFIPERKIKGFELVDYSGKVNFEDAKAVKKQCKEKLLEQASRADIINKALENGEEALKSFFSLILDEPDIKVKFHTHPFDLHYAMIIADTLIDMNEAIFIQDLYEEQLRKLEKARKSGSGEELSMALKENQLMGYFINQLKTLPFIDSGYSFNFYSMAAARMLKDTFHISISDRQKLIELRDTLKIDANDTLRVTTTLVAENPLWFGGEDFRIEFNRTMDVLASEAFSFENIDTCIFKYTNKIRVGDTVICNGEFVVALDTLKLDRKKQLKYSYSDTLVKPKNFFENIQYDMAYNSLIDDSLGADTIAYILNQYLDTVNYSHSIDTLNRAEMHAIIKVEKNKAIIRKKGNPISDLVAGVENFIEGIRKKD